MKTRQNGSVVWVLLLGLFGALPSQAALRTKKVEYKQGDTLLQGYLAYDDARPGKSPGIVIIHEWMGLNEYAEGRARQLAELGYVAFAADIYGKGVRPKDAKEAAELAGRYKSDRRLLRARARAALDILRAHPRVEPRKLVAMGYCFGGTTALELARSGAPLVGTVSFHGNLDTPEPTDANSIRGRVLVLHGGDDPFVPAAQVTAFQQEMREAGVDWEMVTYGGAVHSFTVPTAGNDPKRGAAYNERADRRSFEALKRFLSEIFG
ncbi:MAG: dienelactone hydrolase family protein [Oligoflexia bacterium]|nr:dienelactone hydrolase family protein [Oligoflexia bacterium]